MPSRLPPPRPVRIPEARALGPSSTAAPPPTELSDLPVGTSVEDLMRLLLEPRMLAKLRSCDPKAAAAVDSRSAPGLSHFLRGAQSLGHPYLSDSPLELEPEG